jgi:hypothetical protein
MTGLVAALTGVRRNDWVASTCGPGDVEVPVFVSSEWRWYAAEARRSRISYQALELTGVLAAAAIPTAVALGAGGAVSAILGGCLVLIAGMRQTFDWHENWIRFARVSRGIEREMALYCAGVEPYQDPKESTTSLVRAVSEIVRMDIEQWEARRRIKNVPASGDALPRPETGSG